MRVFRGIRLLALTCLLCLLGCQARPRPTVEVEGEIIYDGQPVTSGIISFLPLEGAEAGSGGAILKGRYRVYPDPGLLPGKYRVEIRWPKPTGEKKKEVHYGESPDIIAEGLPEKYHSESVLTAELEEGTNTINFHLEK